MKNLTKTCLAAVTSAVVLTSCTLSEPEGPTGNASSLHLTEISCMGITVMKVEYDNLNRITEIRSDVYDKINIFYVGNEPVPDKIVFQEYESYTVNDKEELKLSEETILTNIILNSNGYMTRADREETSYFYSMIFDENDKEFLNCDGYNRETDVLVLEYDTNGHLTRNDNDTFIWDGNLLTKVIDNSEDFPQNYYIEYSDVENVLLQWDPFNPYLGPFSITGLVGKAPSHFMTKCTSPEYSETSTFSYTLAPNGLISHERFGEDGDSMLLTYKYKKI